MRGLRKCLLPSLLAACIFEVLCSLIFPFLFCSCLFSFSTAGKMECGEQKRRSKREASKEEYGARLSMWEWKKRVWDSRRVQRIRASSAKSPCWGGGQPPSPANGAFFLYLENEICSMVAAASGGAGQERGGSLQERDDEECSTRTLNSEDDLKRAHSENEGLMTTLNEYRTWGEELERRVEGGRANNKRCRSWSE